MVIFIYFLEGTRFPSHMLALVYHNLRFDVTYLCYTYTLSLPELDELLSVI
jgi:hypothetical protein